MKNHLLNKKFLCRALLFFSPFLLIIVSYFFFDPFKVLYDYTDYYEDYFVEPNRDYVSTEIFLRNREIHTYNAFIFGNSCALAFRTGEWQKHVHAPISPFHFDAYLETLYGIWAKVNLIDESDGTINHALIVVDQSVFGFVDDLPFHLFTKHPRYGGKSTLKFHLIFFKAYFSGRFFIGYMDYRLFRKPRSYMKGLDFKRKRNAAVSNDFFLVSEDTDLSKDPSTYYSEKKFPVRSGEFKTSPSHIDDMKAALLKEIKVIFDKHQSDYKIIINPLYDQISFNTKDLKILEDVFGQDNVYDFSGINPITQSKNNFYDTVHYKPNVGEKIYRQMYGDG